MDGWGVHSDCTPRLFTPSLALPPLLLHGLLAPCESTKLLPSASYHAVCPETCPHGPLSCSWQCFSFPLIAIPAGGCSPSLSPPPSRPGWLCANPLNPGCFWARTQRAHRILVSERSTLFGWPQVQIWLIHLRERQRTSTPPTAPNRNIPCSIVCGRSHLLQGLWRQRNSSFKSVRAIR